MSALFRIKSGLSINDNVNYLEGAGSPESVIAAPVGSIYSDTSGYLYFKASGGTTSSGWIGLQVLDPAMYTAGSLLGVVKDTPTIIDTISNSDLNGILYVKWEIVVVDSTDNTSRYSSTIQALPDQQPSGNVDMVEFGVLKLTGGSPILNVDYTVSLNASSDIELTADITTTGINTADVYFYRTYMKSI